MARDVLRTSGTALLITGCVLGGGCDEVFGLTGREPAADGARPVDADATPLCLADNFEQDVLDPVRWMTVTSGSPPATVTEEGSQAVFRLPAAQIADAELIAVPRYDMTAGTLRVEIAAAPMGIDVEIFVDAKVDRDNGYSMDSFGGGRLLMTSFTAGVRDQFEIPYDPVAHRFWRLRHDPTAMMMNFETSVNTGT